MYSSAVGIKAWSSRAQLGLLTVVTLVLVVYPVLNRYLGVDVRVVVAWARAKLGG